MTSMQWMGCFMIVVIAVITVKVWLEFNEFDFVKRVKEAKEQRIQDERWNKFYNDKDVI